MRTILAAGRAIRRNRMIYVLAGFALGWLAAQSAALAAGLGGLWLAVAPAAALIVATIAFTALGAIVGRVTAWPLLTMHDAPGAPIRGIVTHVNGRAIEPASTEPEPARGTR